MRPKANTTKPKSRAPFNSPPALRPNAAGIDIGAREIYVAVPRERDPKPVRAFETFTESLHKLADWLQSLGIDTVAMESTGVYWIPLYQILEARGIEVFLVNASPGPVRDMRRDDEQALEEIRRLFARYRQIARHGQATERAVTAPATRRARVMPANLPDQTGRSSPWPL